MSVTHCKHHLSNTFQVRFHVLQWMEADSVPAGPVLSLTAVGLLTAWLCLPLCLSLPAAVWLRWEEAALPPGFRRDGRRPFHPAASFLPDPQVLEPQNPVSSSAAALVPGGHTQRAVRSSSVATAAVSVAQLNHQLQPVSGQEISCPSCSQWKWPWMRKAA